VARSEAAASTFSPSDIVDRWTIVGRGLMFDFAPGGSFVRFIRRANRECLETPERSDATAEDRLRIDLRGESHTKNELRLDPKWLMLREPQGDVTIYRREKG
jgi:hypothetical protein